MVAKITIPKSIEAALNYNEKKVQKGVAKCLHAGNYLSNAASMNFYQKLHGFERLNQLNDRASTKTLHVSLNFDPSEKLSDEKLIAIANLYLEKIGFGQQPYLVYKHQDAGHPHIHILSTTIKEDGSRINTHNIGRNQSEKARKEIEKIYGLIKAENQQPLIRSAIKAVDGEKAIYGKSETKRSIANVVTAVFNQYKFISLPEFNAALKQYNVVADRGKEDGRIYKNRGLVYRILDADGNKIGVPIKASSIGCQPTLANLEKKFTLNEPFKNLLRQKTKDSIDECLQTGPGNLKNLASALMQKQVYTLLRQNAEGRLYGITFVDNQNKVVFNGSDLGKEYSAAGIQSRLVNGQQKNVIEDRKDTNSIDISSKATDLQKGQEKSLLKNMKPDSLIDILLSVKEQHDNIPGQLLKKKRKKKKKNHDSNF